MSARRAGQTGPAGDARLDPRRIAIANVGVWAARRLPVAGRGAAQADRFPAIEHTAPPVRRRHVPAHACLPRRPVAAGAQEARAAGVARAARAARAGHRRTNSSRPEARRRLRPSAPP